MKGSEKLAVYVATFIFVILGYFISIFTPDLLSDFFNSVGFTPVQTGAIVLAISWFIVCFLTYWGSTRWLEEGEKVGMFSLFFFILWVVATLGTVVAVILNSLISVGGIILTPDLLLTGFFTGISLALAPSIAALLAVSNKSSHRN